MKRTSFSKILTLFALLLGPNLSILAQTTTFNYTGAVQTYVVPAGVTTLGIDMKGACGGYAYISSGTNPVTLGGRVVCTLAVTPGSTLNIYVGQAGPNWTGSGTSGGYNGGGWGGSFAASGGGASDIRIGGTALANRVVIAGGGGGGGDFSVIGGVGGGLTGGYGALSTSSFVGACGGGQSGPACTTGNQLGTLGQGAPVSGVTYSVGGGGGGSSFTHPTLCTGVVHTQGFSGANGSGQVIITQLCTNPPANTGGTTSICNGGVTTFANATSGGTWASSNSSIASVNSSTGVVTGGSSVGTVTISYFVPGGCYAASTMTNNAMPSISSITSNSPVCSGNTLTLTANSPANVSAYSWTGPGALSSATTSATTVPGAPTSATGTYSLTLSNGTGVGCTNIYTTAATVLASPAAISGSPSVCATFSTILTNSVAGGTWSSTNSSVAPVTSTGSVTGNSAGNATISYTLASGCAATVAFTVNALPLLTIAPSTASTICLNSSSNFTATAAGATFTWAGISGASGLSCSSCASPIITPAATGSNIYSVTATSGAGCTTTSGVTITVNELPADITGSGNVCVGTSTTLSSSTGGTWSSGDVSIATVGVTSGVVTGASTGAVAISYVLPTGCMKTANITVLSTPSGIGGSALVCVNASANLSHSTPGGMWSSSDVSVATVNPAGTVTGVAAGLATISYTLPSGCIVTAIATVNALPGAINGTPVVCEGASTTLTNADAGGVWSVSNSNATIGATSGLLAGVTNGNAVVTYTMPNSCYRTRTATVNALPAPIGGSLAACHNTIAVVTDATSGGSWASSNTSVASIDASGAVIGLSPGISTISYTLANGCRQTATFTVNALPATIGGTLSACQGNTSTLTNADGGGTWASSNTSVATVNASGEVTGVTNGNATITYTLATGCRRAASFTVNPLPLAISGTAAACQTQTSTLFNFTPGGNWSSGAPAIASIDPSGVVTGHIAGLANITYSLATGCLRTQVFTVNPLPGAITGNMAVCPGQSSMLANTTSGGSWSSSTPGVASIDAMTGLVTATTAGNTTISYILPTGCNSTASVTVNPLPANITGTATVCEMGTTALNNTTTGGAWTSESDPTATVNSSGVVTGVAAGTVNITYTLPTGCYRTRNILVNPLPAAISGNPYVCAGASTTLSNTSTGGTWASSTPGTASINASSGMVNGIVAGNTNITYTLPTGCRISEPFVVNPLPASITGPLNVCVGATTTLNNSTGGGSWESSNPANASISSGGVVTGNNAGPATISYVLPTGCLRTANVNVNPLPAPISGNLNVCQGATTALSNPSAGGAWSSSNTTVATVSPGGVVSGVAAGSANITYTLPTTCKIAASIVVNPLPANIAGATQVCVNAATTLSNPTINGTWSSSNLAAATVDGTGTVSGVAAGNTIIYYTLPTGCAKTLNMVVNPLPAAITGSGTVCQGTATTLSNATAGGSWSSSNTSIASVSATGMVTGITPGAVAISYTLPTGCSNSTTMVVEAVPAPITGPATVCVNSTVNVGNVTPGGYWAMASPIASISYLGEATGISAGTAIMTYMLPSGCFRTRLLTVNGLPAPISGANNVCVGAATTLSSATTGGTWNSNSTALATVGAADGVVTGVTAGSALISYSLPTGCKRVANMTINPTPAAIAGTLDVCAGNVTALTTTSTGGVWLSGNTSVATVGLVGGNVTGMAAGMAMVTYSMPTGCMATATVTVNALPMPISGVTNVCEGGTTVLTNGSLGGSWGSAGTSGAINSAGVVSGMAAGNIVVTYTLPTGCYTTANVAVNALPSVFNVTGGGSYCAGSGGSAVGLDGSAPGNTYRLWKHAGTTTTLAGTFTGSGAPIHFGYFTNAAMYTATATTPSGCMADMAGSANVSIMPILTPMVSISASTGDTICAGNTVSFTATATNGGTAPAYRWLVNSTEVATSGSYAYSPANGDVVTVMLTSNAACAMPATATNSRMMTVMSVETPGVSINVSPAPSVCRGTTALFTATAVYGGSAPQYTWWRNTVIPMGTGSTLSYIPSDNDVISCTLNSNYRCPATNNVMSNAIAMNVDEIYTPSVEVVVTPGTTVNEGQQVTFNTIVTSEGPSPTYMWLKNGMTIPGATQPTYQTANLADGDSITCVVTGTGSCGQVSMNSVVMTVLPSTGIATTSIANGDVRLVPNPNNGSFRVTGTLATTQDQTVALEIVNVLGQVVYSNTAVATNGKLDIAVQAGNTLANGMYVLNMIVGNEHKAFHFVIKQ